MRVIKSAVRVVMVALLLWSSLFLAWQSLRVIDFAYPYLYKVMGLDETIATFGPQNLYKKDFHTTTEQERFRIFSEIVSAIHNQGEGLAQIRYLDAQGREIDKLLRVPEVIHLQDVANLIDKLTFFSLGVLGCVLIAGVVGARRALVESYSVNKVFIVSVMGSAVGVVVVMLSGAEAMFYRWHTLVFPEGHQWFFYYQQSLMTTMMRAPDLFGAIAALLGVLSLIYFYAMLALLRKILIPRV